MCIATEVIFCSGNMDFIFQFVEILQKCNEWSDTRSWRGFFGKMLLILNADWV
jgi:hypothetical protein